MPYNATLARAEAQVKATSRKAAHARTDAQARRAEQEHEQARRRLAACMKASFAGAERTQ